jgi:transcriptional regulator with XRE-family HTH domain
LEASAGEFVVTIIRELEALARLHGEFGFRYAQLAQALNTSEPTLHRWRRGTSAEPTPVYLKRLEAMQTFLEELDELFANRRAAAAWLDESLSVLKNRTPRQMILDGHVERVTGVLYALNAGVSL